jgi:peptide-methionine (R)-S-oxide reductase
VRGGPAAFHRVAPEVTVDRRTFLSRAVVVGAARIALPGLTIAAPRLAAALQADPPLKVGRLEKSKTEWRRLLTAPQYAVLFEEDTEPAGSSPLDAEKRAGTFVCAACALPLFASSTKFESGTGWPSFTAPIAGRVATKRDFTLVWPRTEYHCARCGGHQGHRFADGPRPAGTRYCNNGLALRFVPAGEPLPTLRS